MFSFLDTFFNWLEHYSGSPWFYLAIFSIALLDSVLPIVPSESLVIIGGVSAGLHQLHWSLVIIALTTKYNYAVANFSLLHVLFQVGAHFSLSVVASLIKTAVGL